MGRLTTHILDTAQGKPGAGIPVSVYEVTANDRRLIKTVTSNSDGRVDKPLLADGEFKPGTWELEFSVAAYFAASELMVTDPPFLDRVTLRFTVSEDTHYHVPLLVSPWSYSTYRGS